MEVFEQKVYQSAKSNENSTTANPLKNSSVKYNNGGTLIFPDGARITYQNINDKNIYMIVSKYSDYLHPDMTGMSSNIKYKLGRLALTFKDGDAKISVGKINSMGIEFMYKMQYFNDRNLSAMYYYPNRNYEEVSIKTGECVFKSYNALHQLIKMEEIVDNQTKIYEINPETNDIRCISS